MLSFPWSILNLDMNFTGGFRLSAVLELSPPGYDPANVWKLRDDLEKNLIHIRY
ncbi:hypothetical protein [Lacrimispora sp.]|uniref:hypothetical protein n=1 Tax=Lacrimispora sp. TaxID=2719234 RepID=UPI003460C5A7